MKKNATHIKYVFFITLIFLSSCVHKRNIDKRKLHFPDTKINLPSENISFTLEKNISCELNRISSPPPITIWVHGTLLFRRPHYHHIFQKKYALIPATDLPNSNLFSSIAHVIAKHAPEHFPLETFYFFGWTGKLYAHERKSAAEKLYHEILILIEEYKQKYNTEPIIRIIAHSHGGNVVLNMAKIKNHTTEITINSLILLACPVQERTMNLINEPMFKHIYSLYSSLDFVQILAPQMVRKLTIDTITHRQKRYYKFPPFSSRLFPQKQHVTQVKIKLNGYPIAHSSFTTLSFVQILPTILAELEAWHEETIKKNTFNKHKLLCIYQEKNISKKSNQ